MTKQDLMALIDKRDALDAEIEAGMKELGLDAKAVKEVRKAAAKAAAAQKTLNALMGLDIGDPQTKGGEDTQTA